MTKRVRGSGWRPRWAPLKNQPLCTTANGLWRFLGRYSPARLQASQPGKMATGTTVFRCPERQLTTQTGQSMLELCGAASTTVALTLTVKPAATTEDSSPARCVTCKLRTGQHPL